MAGAAAVAVWMMWPHAAKAADLGGSCCTDLEERVAELEATVARKGNRKVSLKVSGFVGHQVMWWDDGNTSDMYIGDGGNLGSRFRFTGTAKINSKLAAGFTYEFGAKNNAIGSMSQGDDDAGGGIEVRDSTAWLRHNQLGMIKIGHGSTATDNLILTDVGGIASASTPDIALFNGGFFPQSGGATTPLTWAHAINGGISFDTARRNHLLYETPTVAGFVLSAAVAENDFWDVALRYAGEFGSFRVAVGIGHMVDKEGSTLIADTLVFGVPAFNLSASVTAAKVTETKGAASIMHVPTGLFLNVAAGQRKLDGEALNLALNFFNVPVATGSLALESKDPFFWHVAGGISKNFFGIGRTAIFAEYHEAKDFLAFTNVSATPTGISDSKVKMIGGGVVQHIDAAAMEVFATIKHYDVDASVIVNGVSAGTLSADTFQTIIVGTKISF